MQKAEGRRQKGNTSPLPSPRSGEGEALTLAELLARGVVGLTKAQMAAAIQVCPRTITEMMRRGQISYWKIGRLVRFRVEDAVKRMNETVLVTAEEGEE
jgi:excisionase family DNA binding protein